MMMDRRQRQLMQFVLSLVVARGAQLSLRRAEETPNITEVDMSQLVVPPQMAGPPMALPPMGVMPKVAAEGLFMFNHARHRSPIAVENTVRAMWDYTDAANTFPPFSHMGLNISRVHGSTSTVFRQLRSALSMLKRDLGIHRKALHHAMYEMHANVPTNVEETDAIFQTAWKESEKNIIECIQRHKLAFDAITAAEICSTAENFLTEMAGSVQNYTRLLTDAVSILPAGLPDKNPWINVTAMDARIRMYETSRDMMRNMSIDVDDGVIDFLNTTMGCNLVSAINRTEETKDKSSARHQQHMGPVHCVVASLWFAVWLGGTRWGL